MSENEEQLNEFDELSHLLDELNAGREPNCDNPEIRELLSVAKIIKNTRSPVRPPQHILDQTVNRALAGVQEGKPKSLRVWFYSGALGTAAAVLLVIGLNFLAPSENKVSVIPIPSASSQDPLQHKSDIKVPPTVYPSDPFNSSKQIEGTTANKQAPANTNLQNNDLPAPPPPSLTGPKKPTDTAREELFIAEAAPHKSEAKSAYSPPATVTESAKSWLPIMNPLTLPGQKPNLVVTDKESGTLRQVYFKGTPKEIIITQRTYSGDTANTSTHAQSPSSPKAVNTLENINIVRVMIAGQEVTVEGRQPIQELHKILNH